MAQSQTASLTIAELREFASFAEHEQRFIERSLDVALGRGDAFKSWKLTPLGGTAAIRGQYIAYRQLKALKAKIPASDNLDGIEHFLGNLIKLTAQDLAQDQLDCFSAYRFLYERLLGAAARPFLPAAFCAAAALPQIRPTRRKLLLQSLSEAAATAPAWSERAPAFFPERIEADAA